jgi:hypothetical protein
MSLLHYVTSRVGVTRGYTLTRALREVDIVRCSSSICILSSICNAVAFIVLIKTHMQMNNQRQRMIFPSSKAKASTIVHDLTRHQKLPPSTPIQNLLIPIKSHANPNPQIHRPSYIQSISHTHMHNEGPQSQIQIRIQTIPPTSFVPTFASSRDTCLQPRPSI